MTQIVCRNPRIQDIIIVAIEIADIPLILHLAPGVDADEVAIENRKMKCKARHQGDNKNQLLRFQANRC